MRVLLVINGLGTGGAERSLAEMLPRYAEHGVNATVACFYHRDEGVEAEVLRAGHDVRFVDASTMLGRARSIRKLVIREGIDLVHTQLFEADIAGRLAVVGLDTPALTSLVSPKYSSARFRDPNVARYKLKAVRIIDRWSGRLLTDHFHAVSNSVKESSVTALGIDPRQITVVERGRDPDRLGRPSPQRRTAARQKLGLDPDIPVLVTVGRQEFPKGHLNLLHAMAAVRRRAPTAIVLVAGREGHASTELRATHRDLGLGDAVRLLGHRDDIPELLAAADLFVFPSLFEGGAGAVIEAMALGLPIVASDIPALREVLVPGENSLLVPPEEPEALAGAIQLLIDDEGLRIRFSQQSIQRFDQRFTLDAVVDRMVRLYAHVIATARRQ